MIRVSPDRHARPGRAGLLAGLLCGVSLQALAQEAAQTTVLPPIDVYGGVATGQPAAATEPGAGGSASLTVPGPGEAEARIQQTPGAVAVIPETQWRETPAKTVKDVFDYTPGVFAQPKWGEDTRLSIRGSGLSRNFHLRGIQLYQDGVPVNASDGGGDFQEIDPTAFQYTEVYKGANGLVLGANSLGGAINFISPTGHNSDRLAVRADIGSFAFRRLQASSGGVQGNVDAFVTGSWQAQDGFRDHSRGESVRVSGNTGWRISPDLETRFYFNAADIEQEIPGSVTRTQALTDPKAAAAGNVLRHYQRNIESFRIANKTTWSNGQDKTVEFGGYAVDKSLIHPIFQFLDYNYHDFGVFGRVIKDGTVAGRDNRLTAGVTFSGGWVDNSQYNNLPGGVKGQLLSQSEDRSTNTIAYFENGLSIKPDLTFVTGLQFVHATRERVDEFAPAPDTSGENDYTFFNPKAGLLWQVNPAWQMFGNISRSGEAPTFSELNFTSLVLSDTKAQRATTYELGTRGRHDRLNWDVAVYRADLENEFQFFDLGGGNYQVTNADDTVHQGIEAGFGWAFWEGILRGRGDPEADRLWLNAAYTFSDFRFDNDPVWGGNELPGAPRHYLRAEVLYKHPDGFFAGPNVEWVPEAYYVDNANTQKTRPYALLGFRFGQDFSGNASFYVDARNLTDEKYIASASITGAANAASALYEPGTGRAIYGGIRVSW